MTQVQPINFQQQLDITSLGISAQNCSFQTLTMESEKFICIREQVNSASGVTSNVVAIELEKPQNVIRHSISADSVLMNPTQNILALKSGQTVQVYNMQLKQKMGSYNIPEPVIYWRWLNSNLIAIVTANSVYQWDLLNYKNPPLKLFDRLETLLDHTIISYQGDQDLKFFALVGLCQPQGGPIIGHIQLYSAEKQFSQPLDGHAAVFCTYNLPGTTQQTNLFCFSLRAAGQNKLCIREISRIDTATKTTIEVAGANKFGHVIDISFSEDGQMDFPVSLIAGPKYDVLYMVTKMGYLHIFDIALGKLIYINKVSTDKDTIFVTTPTVANSGFLGVNRAGKVLSFGINEQTIVPYLISKNSSDVAIRLAIKLKLPGSDSLFMHQFQVFVQEGRYQDAARVASEAPNNMLRQDQTVNLFKSLPSRPGEAPPILQYFGALLERTKLNKLESLELVKIALGQNRKDLLEKWLKEERLESSEELGELVRRVDLKLALSIFLRADAKEKVVFLLAETEQFDQLIAWTQKQNFVPNWSKVLGALAQMNPRGSVNLAKLLLRTDPQAISAEKVIDIFTERNLLQEMTEFALEILTEDKPEDGALQTRVLELNLMQAPNVAEAIFSKQIFSHYNATYLAELSEKVGLMNRALALHSNMADRKRILRDAGQVLDPNFVAIWFSNLSPQQSIDCIKDMLSSNPRLNLPIVVKVAQTYWQELGVKVLIDLFESAKLYDGIHSFLNPILSLVDIPDAHFSYIEAAARLGQIQDVERVVRESKIYDPERVREFLKKINLSDPLPLIIVCNLHGYIEDLTRYLSRNSKRGAIETYVTQMNSESIPIVISTLLDEDSDDDYIKSLLNVVGARCPVGPLVEEVEKRNKLRLLLPWLESLASQGNQETPLHNSLAKIYIDTRNDPETFLTKNTFYDHSVVGKYCESRDPSIAFLVYKNAPSGSCDDDMIRVSNEYGLFKHQAKFLIERRDLNLWSKVLNDKNQCRQKLIEEVQLILPECKQPEDIVVTVRAFMDPSINLSNELIGLVERIIFESSNPEFSKYSNLQNLLILTAIRAWGEENQTKVMEYIKKLDNFDIDSIAESAIEKGLYEEAFVAYQKSDKNVQAIGVLLSNIKSLDRATEYAEQVDQSHVYSRLGKAQLDQGLVSNAIRNFIKADDPRYYHEVISSVSHFRDEIPDIYEDEILFLQAARRKITETKVDSELIYAFTRTGKLDEIHNFLRGTHRANLLDLGETLYEEGFYQAAKILFTHISNYTKLALTLVKLNDLTGAVEMAKKVSSISTWKLILKACIEAQNWKLAQTAGLNIIVHADEVLGLVKSYEYRGYFDHIIKLLEVGLELERTHIVTFTELAILYAKYRPEGLMDHLRQHFSNLNATKVSNACEQNMLWKELSFVLQQDKEFDKCANIAMEHPSAFESTNFNFVIARVNSVEIIYKAFTFHVNEHPLKLVDFLISVSSRVENRKIIDLAKQFSVLPLIKPYLIKIQESNNLIVNETLNDLFILEGDYDAFSRSMELYPSFDKLALAKKLATHPLVEFRKISAQLYQSSGKFTQTLELLKKDKLDKELIKVAAASKDQKIAEDLLTYFLEQNNPQAFSAALFATYSLVRPDVVLELAWNHKVLDFAFPYMIQFVREYTTKVDQMAEAMLKNKHQIQRQIQQTVVHPESVPLNSPVHTNVNPSIYTNFNPSTNTTIPQVYQNPQVINTTQNFSQIPIPNNLNPGFNPIQHELGSQTSYPPSGF